jgi:hypothetical protein
MVPLLRHAILSGAPAAAAAPAFSPLDLSPALWLKADAGTYQTSGGSAASADADPVGEWQDQGGNGRHVSQATGSRRPTLKLAIQNGLPVVRFDGVDDFLDYASLIQSQPYTIWLVASNGTANGYYCDAVAAANGRLVQRVNNTTLRTYQGAIADVTVTGLSVVNSIIVAYSGAASVVNFNGTETAVSPGTATASGFRLGANGSPAAFAAMDLCEAAVFTGVLSAANRAALAAYARTRWGTP